MTKTVSEPGMSQERIEKMSNDVIVGYYAYSNDKDTLEAVAMAAGDEFKNMYKTGWASVHMNLQTPQLGRYMVTVLVKPIKLISPTDAFIACTEIADKATKMGVGSRWVIYYNRTPGDDSTQDIIAYGVKADGSLDMDYIGTCAE